MLSTIIASVLSMSFFGTGAAAGASLTMVSVPPSPTKEYISPPSTAQFNEMVRIEKYCSAKSTATLYEKLTASIQPHLRLVACVQKTMAASPVLGGWHMVPIQTQTVKK